MRLAIDPHGVPDDVSAAAETILPATLAENHHAVVAVDFLRGAEIAAELDLDTEHRQEVRAEAEGRFHLGGLARVG